MKIGLISDTHGYFDPGLPDHFAEVDHILHAGDICGPNIVLQLEKIAPVTAVLGNNDFDPSWREMEVIELGGLKFLIYHIVSLNLPRGSIFETIARVRPDIVVYGHTHRAADELRSGVRYINPGYAGRPGSASERTAATLDVNGNEAAISFIKL